MKLGTIKHSCVPRVTTDSTGIDAPSAISIESFGDGGREGKLKKLVGDATTFEPASYWIRWSTRQSDEEEEGDVGVEGKEEELGEFEDRHF